MSTVEPPSTFAAPYPFVRESVTLFNEDGPREVNTWRPGVRMEFCEPDDTEAVADGIGRIILTIISEHKPGRFPTRVFFTRQWEDPSGRKFGRGALRIATKQLFNRLANGYRHEYRLLPTGTPPVQGRMTP